MYMEFKSDCTIVHIEMNYNEATVLGVSVVLMVCLSILPVA